MPLALVSKPLLHRPIAVLAVAAAVLLPPAPSLADAEAERIEAAVSAFLQGDEAGRALIGHRDVAVVAEAEGYRVQVSDIETHLADGETAVLGDLSFRVQRQGDDYAFDQVSLPERLWGSYRLSDLEFETEELPVFEQELTWASFQLSGIWSPDPVLLKSLNLQVEDAVLETRPRPAPLLGLPEGETFEVAMGRISLELETEEKNKSDWDSTLRFVLGPLRGTLPDVAMGQALSGYDAPGFPDAFLAEIQAEQISSTLEFTGFNPETYAALGPAWDVYIDAIADLDAEAVRDARQEILSLDRLFQGLLVDWQTRGIAYEELWPGGIVYRESQEGRFVLEAPAGSDEMRMVLLGEVDGALERREGASRLYALSGDLDGGAVSSLVLSLLPFSILVEALAPTRSAIALSVDRLPFAETSSLLVAGFGYTLSSLAMGGSAEPVDLNKVAPFEYDEWFAAIDKAQTHILLERLSASGPFLWLDAMADITVDADSASGVVGLASLSLSDLDKAMRQGREYAVSVLELPEGEESTNLQVDSILTLVFATIKGLGAPKVEDGEIVYHYDLAFPADAPATLNGRPLSTLLGQ